MNQPCILGWHMFCFLMLLRWSNNGGHQSIPLAKANYSNQTAEGISPFSKDISPPPRSLGTHFVIFLDGLWWGMMTMMMMMMMMMMVDDGWWMMDDGWWMMDDGWGVMDEEWWMMLMMLWSELVVFQIFQGFSFLVVSWSMIVIGVFVLTIWMGEKAANTHNHLDVRKKLIVLFSISCTQLYHATYSPPVLNYV